MPTQTTQAFNLTLTSPNPIPGSQPTTPPATLTIHKKTLPQIPPTEGPYALLNGALHFHAPTVARYRITPTEIQFDPTAPEPEVTALLLSTALPAVLWMRGQIVLHAAAAILPNETQATAIAGPSGCGKSTFLRHLVAHQATAVADDTIALTADHLCAGLPAGTWLRDGEESIFEAIPPAQQAAHAQLGRIVFLAPEQAGRISAPAALAELLRNLHRPLIPRILGLTPSLLPRLARLAAAVPVYSYSGRPENLIHFLERTGI